MTISDLYGKHYHNRHKSQRDRGCSAKTRQQGCTWTTGANGIMAATGGRLHPSPDTVLSKVATHEQTNPRTPGWSLPDLDLAVHRISPKLDIVIETGWDNLRQWRNEGYYIALQGDTNVFASGCMSDFQGLHCIGVHPDESQGRWRLDDPMCPEPTHRSPERIREYAQALADQQFGGIIRFGVFKPKVPLK